jgi:formylglycine-generating enzyme required for sulfatase activity
MNIRCFITAAGLGIALISGIAPALELELGFAPRNNIIPPRSDYTETTLAVISSGTPVFGLDKSDVIVSNGVALAWRKRNPRLYDLQIQCSNTSGVVTVTIPAGSCRDTNGVPNPAVSAELPIAWAPWAADIKRSHYIVRDRWAPTASLLLPGAASNEVAMKFAWVNPGSFIMGNDGPYDEPQRAANETPHHVTLTKGFWIAETECTQEQWQSVMSNTPSFFQRNRDDTAIHPVESVSWSNAMAFATTLNNTYPGLNASLPTEAQWEYACRAGTRTAFYSAPDDIRGDAYSEKLAVIGWYAGNSANWNDGKESETAPPNCINISGSFTSIMYGPPDYTDFATHRVGNQAKNDWGIKDMSGNVAEWCRDFYLANLGTNAVSDPVATNAFTTDLRVIRGGSWTSAAADCRSCARSGMPPGTAANTIGFRLVIPGNASISTAPIP